MVTRSIGGLPGAVTCRCADEKFDFVEDLASAVNHCVFETLKGIVRLPFNILSTDFVHDDVVERIIEMNESVPVGQSLAVTEQGYASIDETLLETQTITSLSSTFDVPIPMMPPVEIRETST